MNRKILYLAMAIGIVLLLAGLFGTNLSSASGFATLGGYTASGEPVDVGRTIGIFAGFIILIVVAFLLAWPEQ